MAQRELFAFAHLPETGFVPAGLLELTEVGTVVEASTFAYGSRYLERAGAIEIDPVSLSLKNRTDVKGVKLFPANRLALFGGIRDAAPDAWGRQPVGPHEVLQLTLLPAKSHR